MPNNTKSSSEKRLETIDRKYGKTIYRRWGKRGGSPILKAWAQGKLKVKK